MNIPKMYAYRHPEIQTYRPYAFDIDGAGWLWEGQASTCLYAHNTHTAECRLVSMPFARGRGACDVKCYDGKIIVAVQTGGEYLIYDPIADSLDCGILPGEDAQVWYMKKLSDGRLVLFERSESQLILLDSANGPGRVVKSPYPGEISGGSVWSDGWLYMAVRDPARLLCFDLATDQFVAEITCSFPQATLAGGTEYRSTVYYSDSARGRLIPFSLESRSWGEPIPVPGHGEIFGFLGGCTTFENKGYFCTSTYAYPSTLDTKTGKVVCIDQETGKRVPPELANIGVDGKPHRFQGFQIVFDPETQAFSRLDAPPQPDGLPLLCYQWSDEDRFFITGYVIPVTESGDATKEKGDWLILQNRSAEPDSVADDDRLPGVDRD